MQAFQWGTLSFCDDQARWIWGYGLESFSDRRTSGTRTRSRWWCVERLELIHSSWNWWIFQFECHSWSGPNGLSRFHCFYSYLRRRGRVWDLNCPCLAQSHQGRHLELSGRICTHVSLTRVAVLPGLASSVRMSTWSAIIDSSYSRGTYSTVSNSAMFQIAAQRQSANF